MRGTEIRKATKIRSKKDQGESDRYRRKPRRIIKVINGDPQSRKPEQWNRIFKNIISKNSHGKRIVLLTNGA